MVTPHVDYLAHHYLLLAAPAFLPAVVVVTVVLYVALRDRRAGRDATAAAKEPSKPDAPDKERD
jgi:hypothetical protein